MKQIALFFAFVTEWDDTVWTVMVEKAIVHKDKSITFVFYNCSEVRVGTSFRL